MAINLLGIQPHKVSRDLSGYITYIYGAPKTGKTTLATQMGGALLLAFEQGYNALPGVMAQDITSWTEMKQVMNDVDIHFVKNDKDTKPYKHFKKFYSIASVMRIIYAKKEQKEMESGS